MIRYIFWVAVFFLLCHFFSCDSNIFKTDEKEKSKPGSVNKVDTLISVNPFAEIFQPLKPQDRNCGILLGLKTISGYRTLFITYQDGIATVKNDLPGIVYPIHDTLIFIDKFQRDSVFGNILSGWLPDKTTHYWENIYISGNKKELDSIRRNWEKHKLQQFYIPTNENVLKYDSQFVDINYLINFHIYLSFSGFNNYNKNKVYYTEENLYKTDTSLKVISLKPDGLSFINEYNKSRLMPVDLINLFSPKEISLLKQKIKKELFEKSIKNEFADTTPPPILLGKLRADTSEIFYTLKREKGLVKLYANAYAITNLFQLSPTYKLRVEYDCGPLSQPYISHNFFPLDFEKLSSQFEEMEDALVSPFQNFILILNKKSLKGINVSTGKIVFNYQLPLNSKIIMAEWTNTQHFYQWEQFLNP